MKPTAAARPRLILGSDDAMRGGDAWGSELDDRLGAATPAAASRLRLIEGL
jgi:hypothetical protein